MAYKKIFKNIIGNLIIKHLDNENKVVYEKIYYSNGNGGSLKSETYYKSNLLKMYICYYKSGNIQTIRNYQHDNLNYLPSYVSIRDNNSIFFQKYYFEGNGDNITELSKRKKDEIFESEF